MENNASMRTMKFQYSCFLGLILGSCAPHNTTAPAPNTIQPVPRAVVENLEPDPTLPCFKRECESADSAQYTHLKATFYQGQDGEIYEKSYAATQHNKCCYKTDPIPNADAPSFKVVDSSTFDAWDKYRKYSCGHPVN